LSVFKDRHGSGGIGCGWIFPAVNLITQVQVFLAENDERDVFDPMLI
jgi:hypothetical protein